MKISQSSIKQTESHFIYVWSLGFPQSMSLLLRKRWVRAQGCSPWRSLQQARCSQSRYSEQACWPRRIAAGPEILILLCQLDGCAWQQTWGEQRNPGGIFTAELKQHGSEEAKDRTVGYPIFNKDGWRRVKKRTLKWVGNSIGVGRKRPSLLDCRPLLHLFGFLSLCWVLPSGLSLVFFQLVLSHGTHQPSDSCFSLAVPWQTLLMIPAPYTKSQSIIWSYSCFSYKIHPLNQYFSTCSL